VTGSKEGEVENEFSNEWMYAKRDKRSVCLSCCRAEKKDENKVGGRSGRVDEIK